MDIRFAVLALLAASPSTGYRLKKYFAESESLHWSGNNNQVYAALLALHRAGLVSREEREPAGGPASKLFQVTAAGVTELRRWMSEDIPMPGLRFPVLTRLLAADLLSAAELDALLLRYEETLRLKCLGLEELRHRGAGPSWGSPRQELLLRRLFDRALEAYRAELAWVVETRALAVTAEREEPAP